MSLYKNKYRIESARWKGWDYRNAAAYFITICTKDRLPFLGNCTDGQMHPSDMGMIANKFWAGIPRHFSNVDLGEYIIMPNHLHGVLILNTVSVETLHCNVSTMTTPTNKKNQFMSGISPKPGSVSTIIRSYKSVCTKEINVKFPAAEFAWQTRFHDHIIRNLEEYNRIENYIINNPSNWNKDKFFIS
jgi:REP element-mobilizing transposase RayT